MKYFPCPSLFINQLFGISKLDDLFDIVRNRLHFCVKVGKLLTKKNNKINKNKHFLSSSLVPKVCERFGSEFLT